jgi:KaiC/GvpD/RAD55 family RecA-like ATPase
LKKIATGIAGLDEFLKGGLPPQVLLLVGPPGCGSEVFARQIAYSRAKQNGVTYFTVDKNPESVMDDISIFRWNVLPLQQKGRWKFISPNDTDGLETSVKQEMKKGRCLVIDSLSEFLLSHNVEEAINLYNLISTQNRECQNLHFILLTEGMQNPKVETTMQHFAEGVITFATRWEAATLFRNMLIKKIKGVHVPSRRFRYSIGKRGFILETAIRIT